MSMTEQERRSRMQAFRVTIDLDGEQYVFQGDRIRRDIEDGAGRKILSAPVIRERDGKHGVVNLNADWTLSSLYID